MLQNLLTRVQRACVIVFSLVLSSLVLFSLALFPLASWGAPTHTGTVVDAAGDAVNANGEVTAGDFSALTVNVDSEGFLDVVASFVDGTFDPQRTGLVVSLDIDADTTTGSDGEGIDYLITVNPQAASTTAVHSIYDPNSFTGFSNSAGVGTLTALADGWRIQMPLSLYDTTVSNVRFSAASQYVYSSNTATGVNDSIPDIGTALPVTAAVPTGEPGAGLFAAVLPSSRSVQIGASATVFATMINASVSLGTGCRPQLAGNADAAFSYQTTDPVTNGLTGSADTPVDIPPGEARTFVMVLQPNSEMAATQLSFEFSCETLLPAPVTPGVNTLLLAASAVPSVDVVALAATQTGNGIVDLPGHNPSGAFAVATVNVGAEGPVVVSATSSGGAQAIQPLLCQSDPVTAACLAAPSDSVAVTMSAGSTPTFSVFVSSASPVGLDPGANRISVRFAEPGGQLRGSTSVAVRAETPLVYRQLPGSTIAPAANAQARMPVVIVSYIPTADGQSLDPVHFNYQYRPPEWIGDSVDGALGYIDLIATRKKFFLEERSKFRGYKDPSAAPYLGYEVLAHIVFEDSIPRSSRSDPFNSAVPMFDYAAMMSRINGDYWVNTLGAKEIWVMSYFDEANPVQLWESNMSSPSSADISNSDQFSGDLPVLDHTYVVYGINYQRTQAEAIHNHGHQVERMFDYIDRRASGTSDLFWGSYVGVEGFPGPLQTPGRCGWTHSPPNTQGDYDYRNNALVESDCEDWRPDGSGATKAVNSNYFLNLNYSWPGGSNISQKAETQFYLWWMQNFPGDGAMIPYQTTTMENWWRIIADWDAAIANNINLYR